MKRSRAFEDRYWSMDNIQEPVGPIIINIDNDDEDMEDLYLDEDDDDENI